MESISLPRSNAACNAMTCMSCPDNVVRLHNVAQLTSVSPLKAIPDNGHCRQSRVAAFKMVDLLLSITLQDGKSALQ